MKVRSVPLAALLVASMAMMALPGPTSRHHTIHK